MGQPNGCPKFTKKEIMMVLNLFEKLQSEVFLPKEAERAVKILLYVDRKSYQKVKEIVETGKTASRILFLANAVERGLPLDFILEGDESEDECVTKSIMDALEQKVPKDIIREMRRCELDAEAIRVIANRYRKGIPHKALRLAIKPHMDCQQVKVIMDAVAHNTYEEAEVISDPELDWYQMKTILKLYVYGLTVEEAKSIISPYNNCKRLMEMGHVLIYSREQQAHKDRGC